jgi:hypothetical protein
MPIIASPFQPPDLDVDFRPIQMPVPAMDTRPPDLDERGMPSIDTPVSEDEPDTYMGGALRGFAEGAFRGPLGFIKEAPFAVAKGVRNLVTAPVGLVRLGGSVLKNDYDLLTKPGETLSKLGEDIQQIPAKVGGYFQDLANLAATDPEAFGAQAADLTGDAMVGIAAQRLIPLAPRPLARKVGGIIETTGKKGEWPIRMMGAHKLGAGNPLGVALMAAPEALQGVGKAIRVWGEGPELPAREAAIMLQRGGAPSTLEPPVIQSGGRDLMDEILAEERQARMAKAASKATSAVDPNAPPAGWPSNVPYDPNRLVGGIQPLRKGPRVDATPPSKGIRVTGKAAQDLQGEVPSPMLANTQTAPVTPKQPKVSVADSIPKSKSKGAMSATPGLTVADMEELGFTPDQARTVVLKNVTPGIIERVKANRASRHQTHYSNAVSDKDFRSVLEQILLERSKP